MLYRREVSRPAIYVTFQPDNDPTKTEQSITQLQERTTRKKRMFVISNIIYLF